MSGEKLPDGWEWSDIKGVGEIVSGGTPSTKEGSYWGSDVGWISPSDLTGYNNKTISSGAKSLTLEGLQNSSAKIMPAGSVHFSSRAPIGYVVISSQPLSTNQGFKSVIPAEGIFNEYVYYYLTASKQIAEQNATGTTFKEISGRAFGKLPFPTPPTNEQKRIVAKIEELFSELDKGIESLKLAQEQLKVYRQAVLKQAFEGKLTAKWREENKEKLESADDLLERIKKEREEHYHQQIENWSKDKTLSKPQKHGDLKAITSSELTSLPEIPDGWLYVRLAEIAKIGSGMSVSKSRKLKDPIEVPYLRVANVQRGQLILDQIKQMTIEKNKLKDLELEDLDILFNEGGDRDKLGRGWIWESQIKPCITQNHVFRASAVLKLDFHAKYISHWGNTFGQKYFDKQGKQTTNLASINKGVLSHFPIPLQSLAEQEKIMEILEEKLSSIDNIELDLAAHIQKSEALRQSILKKAFSGQLVSQDPTDEPASVLLERIRADKEATQSIAKKTKLKKKENV